jgi:hypothetical protein
MIHISNFGSHTDNMTADLHGYLPLPGTSVDDFDFDLGSVDTDDADEMAYWRDDWFREICQANQRAVDAAHDAIADWQER